MSGSTILDAQMAIHKMQQEMKRLKDEPGYAEACSKIYPIIEKYRSLAGRITTYAMGGGIVAGAILGAATGYSLEAYLPNNMQIGVAQIGEYPTFYFAAFGSIIGEIVGGVISISKEFKLKRKAKKEIDGLGLEYTVDEGFF